MKPLLAIAAGHRAESWADHSMDFLKFLADFSIKGVLLLAAAALLNVVLKRASAAMRDLIWRLTLMGLVILPLLVWLLPAWRLPILPQATLIEQHISESLRVGSISERGILRVPNQADNRATGPIFELEPKDSLMSSLVSVHWPMGILITWAGGVLVVMSWLLVGRMGVWKMEWTSRSVINESWVCLLQRLASQLGIQRKVRLIENGKASVPLTWGLLHPVILLPLNWDRWSDEQRRAILLHELVHIKRWDDLAQRIAQLACAIHWFNPLAWVAIRQLRIEREQACDDQVLLAGTKPSDYATILLEAFKSQRVYGHPSLRPVLPIAGRDKIEARLLAILDSKQNRQTPTAMSLAMASMIAIGLWTLLAIAQPARRADNLTAQKNWNSTQGDETPLMVAARKGSLETVDTLLDQDADIDARTLEGETALFRAAASGKTAMVTLLVNRGGDVNAKTKNGVTALIPAIYGRHARTAQTLINLGAEVNARENLQGGTALMAAVRGGETEIVKALIAKGAKVDARDEMGDAPLLRASLLGHMEIAKTLLSDGADANAGTEDGFTPLMAAATESRVELVRALLEKGADVHAKTKDGFTALSLAAREGHPAMVELLKNVRACG